MPSAISVKNLGKKFDLPQKPPEGLFSILPASFFSRHPMRDFWALKDLSFEAPAGRTLGIIGRNGSGKSTLLKIIAGILSPTSGEVHVSGRVAALLELGAGFHEELTGMENIFLNGAILGLSRVKILSILPDIIEFSGLKDFMDTPIKRYSSGMKARLGFSVAVHVEPEILLVDEVISVGDMEFQSKCMNQISEFRRMGKTIVIVTHEIDVASHLCDDLLWLESGGVRAHGAPAQIAHEYRRVVYAPAGRGDSQEAQAGPAIPFFKCVRLLNGGGEVSQEFRSQEPMTIEVAYDASDQVIRHPVITLTVTRSDNIVATVIASRDAGMTPDTLSGAGYLHIRFEPLLLLMGEYSLTLSLYDEEQPETPLAEMALPDAFHVGTRRLHNPDIVSDIPCRWTFTPESPGGL